MLKGQLTGDLKIDDWNFHPGLAVIYFEDRQKAYTDSLGINISDTTVSLGRATFGPRLSKPFQSGSVRLQPSIEVRGIWDFDQAEILIIDSGLAQVTDSLRARTEAGLAATFASGTTLSFEGFFDGIGAANYEAYGAQINLGLTFD